MECRIGCGACCIAPSISSPLPGMPQGKAAGIRCVNLDSKNMCRLWGTSDFPKVCKDFRPEITVCGNGPEEAMVLIQYLEWITSPRV